MAAVAVTVTVLGGFFFSYGPGRLCRSLFSHFRVQLGAALAKAAAARLVQDTECTEMPDLPLYH
jgi:hypothetical protein